MHVKVTAPNGLVKVEWLPAVPDDRPSAYMMLRRSDAAHFAMALMDLGTHVAQNLSPPLGAAAAGGWYRGRAKRLYLRGFTTLVGVYEHSNGTNTLVEGIYMGSRSKLADDLMCAATVMGWSPPS